MGGLPNSRSRGNCFGIVERREETLGTAAVRGKNSVNTSTRVLWLFSGVSLAPKVERKRIDNKRSCSWTNSSLEMGSASGIL